MRKAKTFENISERLNAIIALLDSDNLSLEEMMKLYHEGVELTNEARKILDSYEAELTIIDETATADSDGE